MEEGLISLRDLHERLCKFKLTKRNYNKIPEEWRKLVFGTELPDNIEEVMTIYINLQMYWVYEEMFAVEDEDFEDAQLIKEVRNILTKSYCKLKDIVYPDEPEDFKIIEQDCWDYVIGELEENKTM